MKITDKLIKASCSPTVYKRGMEYFKEGRVHLRRREDNLLTAIVDGSGIYSVEVEFNDREITKCFCTCPYNQTMHTVCKHIVAVMRQRRAEIEEGGGYSDENDRIAARLCNSFFSMSLPKEETRLKFKMYVNINDNSAVYSASILTAASGGELNGIENFLECCVKGKKFKIDKNLTYVPNVTKFADTTAEILSILAESYLDKSTGNGIYSKAVYQTLFGEMTAARLFPYIKTSDISLVFNGVPCSNMGVYEEDPDILIDIFATGDDISLFVSERGTAFTASGEWFLFDGNLYHTTEGWRRTYMPIYEALAEQNRTRITFKNDSRIMFAKYALPALKKCRGVTTQGVDELIIDDAPDFGVYFDAVKDAVTAVVIARYGDVAVRLPAKEEYGEKIILRDMNKEKEVLDVFSGFDYSKGTYSLKNGEGIFSFVKNKMSVLSELAEVKTSGAFDALFSPAKTSITAFVGYNEDTDLLEVGFDTNLSRAEISEILSAVKLKKPFYRFEDGKFLDFSTDENAEIFDILAALDFSDSDIDNERKYVSKNYALYLASLKSAKQKSSFKNFINDMRNVKANIPENLDGVLREYQKSGILWLKQLSCMGLGGILADDMGLGKTLQVLAFIHGERPETPTLIVTPSAITYNWQNEIARFIPDAASLIIDGAKPIRTELLKHTENYEFIITSYPMLRRDIALYKNLRFKYMFIDEAQNIKNEKTLNAHAVKRINAECRFAVTGTPIENSLSELWSVFDYIMPGYLYSHREFNARYTVPISKDGNGESAGELRSKIKPFIMRRMKSEVLTELPEKIEETIYADLTVPQKNMYAAFLETAKRETRSLLSEGADKMRILTLLMRLRQICCHPSLFDANYAKDSGKLNLLLEITESALTGGHRLLIFSQFTSMLDIIKKEFDKMGISYFYLDGKTPSNARAETAEKFNAGEKDVFLISLKAGGTGLNLTGADMVIHYDPWWNPAVTDQASDRAYRIGQKRAVQVIRLASKGTIEEKILKLQDKKRALADDIITANNKTLKNLTDEEIMALFE
ncbi:MAG: DEAD/DEAH box helicase [Firmicutes bacterium]|nr:DEAD/DEAH box helicase [Bacillota bacterium]